MSTELDHDERALFASLVAHGVAPAHADDDVSGFAMTQWSPRPLPVTLMDALRGNGVRVVGLDEDEPDA